MKSNPGRGGARDRIAGAVCESPPSGDGKEHMLTSDFTGADLGLLNERSVGDKHQ